MTDKILDRFFYDKEGKPLKLMEWAELFEDFSYRKIADTDLPDGYSVSTVWCGHNIALFPEGPYNLFETAIFKNGRLVEVYARAHTLEQAKEIHKLAVFEHSRKCARCGINPPYKEYEWCLSCRPELEGRE